MRVITLVIMPLVSACSPRTLSLPFGAQSARTTSSSVYSGSADVEITGVAGASYFGYTFTAAGDLNGDGIDDIAVGAYSTDLSTGAVHIFYGSATGPALTPDLTLPGTAGSAFGFSVSGGGDLNGDGYADLVVGAPDVDSSTGDVYAFYGSAAGLDPTPGSTLSGSGTSSKFGYSVSMLGDVNGDGYADVAVGAPYTSGFKGEVTVAYGSSSGLSDTTTISGASYALLGTVVAAAGDVHADGYADLLVYGSGVRLYRGSKSGLDTSGYDTISYSGTGSSLGLAMSAAGDVNADGYGDVFLGAYQYDLYRGLGLVAFGSSAGLAPADMVAVDTPSTGIMFGYAVAGVGDVDGDGYDDVAGLSPLWETTTEHGRLDVYLGGSPLDIVSDGTAYGDAKDAGYGYSVSAAGDLNADGYQDIMVGQYARGGYTGAVWIYYGGLPVVPDTGDTAVPTDDTADPDTADTSAPDDSDPPDTDVGGDDTSAPDDSGPPVDTYDPWDSGDGDSDPTGDDGGSGDDGGTADDGKAGGCGCASGAAPAGGALALLPGLLLVARRRRA